METRQAGVLEYWSDGVMGFPVLQHSIITFWDQAVSRLKPEPWGASGSRRLMARNAGGPPFGAALAAWFCFGPAILRVGLP